MPNFLKIFYEIEKKKFHFSTNNIVILLIYKYIIKIDFKSTVIKILLLKIFLASPLNI